MEKILEDPAFDITKEELDSIVDVKQFIGCASMQTEDYVKVIKTILSNYEIDDTGMGKVNV